MNKIHIVYFKVWKILHEILMHLWYNLQGFFYFLDDLDFLILVYGFAYFVYYILRWFFKSVYIVLSDRLKIFWGKTFKDYDHLYYR
jgi:hypothetical protein